MIPIAASSCLPRPAVGLGLLILFAKAAAAPAVLVTAQPLAALTFLPEHSAPAMVQARNQATLNAEIAGRIQQIHVPVGAEVEAGQTLVGLDCREARLNLRHHQAELVAVQARAALAAQQYRRAERLAAAQQVAEDVLQQRATDRQALQAEQDKAAIAVEQAALDVRRCVIQAPFAGVVAERIAAVGERAAVGTALLKIVESADAEVVAQIPLTKQRSLMQAEQFTFSAQGQSYPLSLRILVRLAEPRSRSRQGRWVFTEQPALPGLPGRLIWSSHKPHIPADLLVRRGQQLGVMLLKDRQARWHPLPQALEGQPAAIDLPPSTRVIIEGRQAVTAGAAVKLAQTP